MKAIDIINKADNYKPNGYTVEDKLDWLNDLEKTIYRDIIAQHANPDDITLSTVSDVSDELIATDGDVYIYWLLSQIDMHNGDLTRYNNDSALFNQALSTFRNYWTRTHRPNAAPKLKY